MQWHDPLIQLGTLFSRTEGMFLSAFLGLFLGSFFNVCADRYIAHESIVWPPSHCTVCGARLRSWELIPVLSWLFLRGRCAHCQSPISIIYPVSELVTAFLFAMTALFTGWSHALFVLLFFVSLYTVASLIDLKEKILPDVLTLPAAALALPAAIWILNKAWISVVLGGLIGAGVFWLILLYYKKRTGTDGMGYGDVKLMLSLGFLTGVEYLPLMIILAGVMALAAFAIVKLSGVKSIRQYEMPFGPFLSLGAWICWLVGSDILRWWITVIR